MNCGDYNYIWQASDWPSWRFDLAALAGPMAEVSRAQGLLMGRLADVGLAFRDQASLAALTEDVVKTSEIEGEQLNVDSVRSSIARRLGVDIGALAPVDRLLGWAVPHLAPDGLCLFLKGARSDDELTAAAGTWTMAVDPLPSRSDPSGRILRLRGVARAAPGRSTGAER